MSALNKIKNKNSLNLPVKTEAVFFSQKQNIFVWYPMWSYLVGINEGKVVCSSRVSLICSQHDNAQIRYSERIFPPVSQHFFAACENVQKIKTFKLKDPHFHQNRKKLQRLYSMASLQTWPVFAHIIFLFANRRVQDFTLKYRSRQFAIKIHWIRILIRVQILNRKF
jgi:hypothetical protein